MLRPHRIAALPIVLCLCAALLACTGSGDQPEVESTAEPMPTASAGTTNPTQELPTPSSSGPARVSTTINGSCKLADNGSEITITYRVTAEGSAQISRIRFLVDGVVTEETTASRERDIRRNATIKVPDGTTHIFQVMAEAGSNMRSSSSTTVRCAAPTKGPTL